MWDVQRDVLGDILDRSLVLMDAVRIEHVHCIT